MERRRKNDRPIEKILHKFNEKFMKKKNGKRKTKCQQKSGGKLEKYRVNVNKKLLKLKKLEKNGQNTIIDKNRGKHVEKWTNTGEKMTEIDINWQQIDKKKFFLIEKYREKIARKMGKIK